MSTSSLFLSFHNQKWIQKTVARIAKKKSKEFIATQNLKKYKSIPLIRNSQETIKSDQPK